jgi:hypothetical protein
MTRRIIAAAVGLAALSGTGCADRPPLAPAPEDHAAAPVPPAIARPEGLARQLARALANPAFRAYVKAQLDASPYREHKLQFQRFLYANGGRALHDVARESALSDSTVQRAAAEAIPLEVYFPVPAHRAAWTGDENVLVATAIGDHEAPVAFSPKGQRFVLSPDTPPVTPVIAIVPVETDFDSPVSLTICDVDCLLGGGDGGGGGTVPQPGLYMTKSHFVKDFEGWLKGAPEFEIHILGQQGQSDSLKDLQCIGEQQPAPYNFNQDDLDWTGSVMLFSQTQIDSYKTAHPGQGVRVFALEDDDTPCVIKTDNTTLNRIFTQTDSIYRSLTGGRDSTASTTTRIWKAYNVLKRIWTFVAGLIKTNDDLIGTAIEDKVVGDFSHPGYNWIVKGDGNVTNGWLLLEMK